MSHAVHAFQYRNENIIFDGLTHSLFTIDDLGYEVIRLFPSHTREDIERQLSPHYPAEEVEEAYREIRDLVEDGVLFQEEETWLPKIKDNHASLPLSGMCLNISHDCNLRCRYCFAGTGPYGQKRSLMPFEVARQAIDWLIQESQQATALDVDFFGGEPLLNLPVVRQVVQYAREKEKTCGKQFHFSLTTNGTIMDEDILTFLNTQHINLIVSLDGRPEVHNRMRPGVGGRDSYDRIAANLHMLRQSREDHLSHRYGRGTYTYIRGTFTRENRDFAEDVRHLHNLGFNYIAMEPVMGTTNDPWVIRKEDLPVLLEQYDRLVDMVLEKKHAQRPLNFHHFEIDLTDGPCFAKRATGCGAGTQYLAVTPEGDLYPCHQFVGNEPFRMGTVWTGIRNTKVHSSLQSANAGQKKKCRTCFARYLCSGGCHANHWKLNHDLMEPDDLSCQLIRKRLECALYLLTQTM